MTHSTTCLMCNIVSGHERSWIVAEDERHLACLTPFPSTPGFTVVLTRQHHPGYVFALDPGVYHGMLGFAREVALTIDRALGTRRTAMMVEGMAIDHAHIKLMPLHGIPEGAWAPITAPQRAHFDRYEGYITSLDGERAPDAELDRVAETIRRAGRAG